MNTNEQVAKRGPGRPPKTVEDRLEHGEVTVRMPPALRDKFKAFAREHAVSYSTLGRQAIAEFVARHCKAA